MAHIKSLRSYEEALGGDLRAVMIVLPKTTAHTSYVYRCGYEKSGGGCTTPYRKINQVYKLATMPEPGRLLAAIPLPSKWRPTFIEVVNSCTGTVTYLSPRFQTDANPYMGKDSQLQVDITVTKVPDLPPITQQDPQVEDNLAVFVSNILSMSGVVKEHEAVHVDQVTEVAGGNDSDVTTVAMGTVDEDWYDADVPIWITDDDDDDVTLFWCNKRHWDACNMGPYGMVPPTSNNAIALEQSMQIRSLMRSVMLAYVRSLLDTAELVPYFGDDELDVGAVWAQGIDSFRRSVMIDENIAITAAAIGRIFIDAIEHSTTSPCDDTQPTFDFIDYNAGFLRVRANNYYDTIDEQRNPLASAVNAYTRKRWKLHAHERMVGELGPTGYARLHEDLPTESHQQQTVLIRAVIQDGRFTGIEYPHAKDNPVGKMDLAGDLPRLAFTHSSMMTFMSKDRDGEVTEATREFLTSTVEQLHQHYERWPTVVYIEANTDGRIYLFHPLLGGSKCVRIPGNMDFSMEEMDSVLRLHAVVLRQNHLFQ